MSKPSKPGRPKHGGEWKGGPKVSREEARARVTELFRIRLDGTQFHDVQQYAAEKQWGVSDRQLWEYVAQADRLCAERHEADREQVIARPVAQRRTLYARAVNAADYRTALAVLDSEAKLLGLYPDERRQVNVSITAAAESPPPDGLSADDLALLADRAGMLGPGPESPFPES